jgi:uncharacterized protein YabN with tetrapyrrole methylase and pyrophosphatase domain
MQPWAHATPEAIRAIQEGEKVFFAGSNGDFVRKLCPTAEDLTLGHYSGERESRVVGYNRMIEATLAPVRDGKNVCVAYYGSPAVATFPAAHAVKRARFEGFEATLLPAISCIENLFADLGVDPTSHGTQIYEASNFLFYKAKLFDPGCHLILLQIGLMDTVGRYTGNAKGPRLSALVEKLSWIYGREYPVVLYTAATLPQAKPIIRCIALSQLPKASVDEHSTLYIPPRAPRAVYDAALQERLDIVPATGVV